MRVLGVLAAPILSEACTNILVSKGASQDGSTMVAYNADEGSFFGGVGHFPAAHHSPGAMREVWDWETSTYSGSIPEATQTYNVVGNANEYGLVIGETTFGGLDHLVGSGMIDYGSLIWLALQRARTAREAIATIDQLLQLHGYKSSGESFSIADGEEIWLMELVGKGMNDIGAVWVAMRVPDGYITSTANQARIRTFPLDDPDNCLYAKDVVTFAQERGLYPQAASPEEFSFSDTYDPVSFFSARVCEARVWNIFQPVSEGDFDQYFDYAVGKNLTNRMPLFAKAAHKLHVNDTMNLMRTHFEGTYFDPSGTSRKDVGAGAGNSPYRFSPLTWEVDGEEFFHERTVSYQKTAWTFVAQSRGWLPEPIRALFWFAPDDSATAVRIPLYGGARAVPPSFADYYGQDPASRSITAPKSDAYTMSMDSAFWVYNLVAHVTYGERYSEVYPLVQDKIHFFQKRFFERTAAIDEEAAAMFKDDPASTAGYHLISEFGVKTGEQMTKDWRDFWMFLFSRIRDFQTVTAPELPVCKLGEREGCTARPLPEAAYFGYSKEWLARIVVDDEGKNGDHYRIPTDMNAAIGHEKIWATEKRGRHRARQVIV